MHALLETNKIDDILFVQEPWFSRVGTARSVGEREGRDILGGAAHNKWELAYPYFSGDQQAKVMTYTCIHERGPRGSPSKRTQFGQPTEWTW